MIQKDSHSGGYYSFKSADMKLKFNQKETSFENSAVCNSCVYWCVYIFLCALYMYIHPCIYTCSTYTFICALHLDTQ